MKGILKHIPNAITCGNLICGMLSIKFALQNGDLQLASYMIILAAVLDFFDGLVARALGVASPIGKDLDSLADVVSFGVAPSFLLYAHLTSLLAEGASSFIAFPVFLIGAFAGLRLAKFNNDTRQSTSFIGLPVPSNAMFWIGFVSIIASRDIDTFYIYTIIYPLVALFSYFMVSELPMFSLKLKGGEGFKPFVRPAILLILGLSLLPFYGLSTLAIVIATYILICIFDATIAKNVK